MATGEVQDPKYKGINAEIAAELQMLEIQYFRQNKPVPFGDHLMIYPAKVYDYEAFANCAACLTLNKNTTIEGLKMTNLEFLISKTQSQGNEGSLWSYRIQRLFEMVFHIKNGLKCKECGTVMPYDSPEFRAYAEKVQENIKNNLAPDDPVCSKDGCGSHEFIEMIKIIKDPETDKYYLLVDGEKIDSKAFNRLRQIILFQNYPDYRDDSWVDPALKADYEAKMELERKNSDVHATIEKKVVCLSISTHYSIDEIWEMSIRHFTMALSTVDDLINYKIMKQAVSTGFVSLPKGQTIEHWIYKPEKDMYGNAYKDIDSIKEQVSHL